MGMFWGRYYTVFYGAEHIPVETTLVRILASLRLFLWPVYVFIFLRVKVIIFSLPARAGVITLYDVFLYFLLAFFTYFIRKQN